MQESTGQASARLQSITGIVILGVLVLTFASWMFLQSEPPNGRQSYTAPSEVAGFRADAWFLPDDPLLGFALIPAGPFLMGSDPTTDPLAFGNEQWTGPDSGHGTVELPAFYIGRYEVTVAQFGAFVAATAHTVFPETLAGAPNHPVVAVSWPDALAYCAWLETMLVEGSDTPAPLRELLSQGGHVTLPSEAQWEKAARGPDGRVYPWGSAARGDRANYAGNSTTAVGTFDCPECPFGLSDMAGNVWEWTRSPYQSYPYDETDDRSDLDSEALWVMRGGSFTDTERNIRTGVRGGAGPDVRRPFMGFRVVISSSGAGQP